jgi:pseudaminic acid biosynthesis-associated methylase
MNTTQEKFWQGDFGKTYTERNSFDQSEWDEVYRKTWGLTKIEMNERAMAGLSKDIRILEVGCNVGMQLSGFQRMGFKNLYGIELQPYAVEKAKKNTKDINIIQGSGFDIPFKDEYFDLVCTNGVLIHIAPGDLNKIMSEIFRCSNKYIMGFEYFAEEVTDIEYRGNKGFLWKADYEKIYRMNFPSLKPVKKDFYKYITASEKGNTDCMFLLQKK